MLAPRQTSFDRSEFLEASPLLRHGPRAVLAFALVFSIGVIAACWWRVHDGRAGEYTKTFDNASAVARTVGLGVHDLLDDLALQARDIERAYALGGTARNSWIRSRGPLHQDVEQVLFDAHLHPAAQADDADSVRLSETASELLKRAAPMDGEGRQVLLMPAGPHGPNGEALLPVMVRWNTSVPKTWASASGAAPVAGVLFFVPVAHLARYADAAFGTRAGWTALRDRDGRLLMSVASNGFPSDGATRQTLSTVSEAMQHDLDWQSTRLLMVQRPVEPGVFVSAGIAEQDALQEFRRRVAATWAICAVALVPLALVCFAFAYFLGSFGRVDAYLRRVATVDVLTGLPNRRSFNRLLAKALARSRDTGQPFALFMIDLDDFKYINDAQGHELGDELLRHTAKVLTSIGDAQFKVCRLAGDEFMILCDGMGNATRAGEIGQQIVQQLSVPVVIRGSALRTRASIGVVLCPSQAFNAADLMRYADTAMYEAKHRGKSRCVVFDNAMAARIQDRVETSRELEHAIANDELRLVYQPKFCLVDGHVEGMEALVRWLHPKRGLLAPGAFISLAEETGLIGDLGQWVLERAIRQIADWQRDGHDVPRVAVNVSALQLHDEGFVQRLRELLATYKVPGQLLQIEITESALTNNLPQAQALVRGVRECGVSVALDDFGTGYSSMASLQAFDLDLLKVDRSFVSRLDRPDGLAVCRAIVRLGHALGMKVIAEGVETPAQLAALQTLRCDQAQGYLLARPIDPGFAILQLSRADLVFTSAIALRAAQADESSPQAFVDTTPARLISQ